MKNDALKQLEAENNLLQKKLSNLVKNNAQKTKKLNRLNSMMKNYFLDTVEIIQNIIEIKAPGTKEHSDRVAASASTIASEACSGTIDVELIRVAAKIHEVGKIAVPESILSKPMPLLTGNEMKLLQSHPVTAALCFKDISTFKKIAKIIKHKNEHFNGTGRPDGLGSDAIPTGARILAIADYFDTIYFRTGEYEDPVRALNAVQKKLDSQFDPQYFPYLSKYVNENYLDYEKPDDHKIALSALCPGMVISRNLTTIKNVLLLPADTKLSEDIINKLIKHQNIDPIHSGVYIYNDSMGGN